MKQRIGLVTLALCVWVFVQLQQANHDGKHVANYHQFDKHFKLLPIGRTNKHTKGLNYWKNWLYSQYHPVTFNQSFTLLHFDSQAAMDMTHEPIHQCSPSQLLFYEQFVHTSLETTHKVLRSYDTRNDDSKLKSSERIRLHGYFENFVWVFPDHWLQYSQKYVFGLNYHYFRKLIYYQKFYVHFNKTSKNITHFMELQCDHVDQSETPCDQDHIAHFFEKLAFNGTGNERPIIVVNNRTDSIREVLQESVQINIFALSLSEMLDLLTVHPIFATKTEDLTKSSVILDIDFDFFACLDPSEQIFSDFDWNDELLHSFNYALEHHQYNPSHMIADDSNHATLTLLNLLIKNSDTKHKIGIGISFKENKKLESKSDLEVKQHLHELKQVIFEQSQIINTSNLIRLATEENWPPQVLRESLYHSYRYQMELNKYYQTFTRNLSAYNHFVENLDHFLNIHNVIDTRLGTDINHQDISPLHHTDNIPHIMFEINPLLARYFDHNTSDLQSVRKKHHTHVASLHNMGYIHSLQPTKVSSPLDPLRCNEEDELVSISFSAELETLKDLLFLQETGLNKSELDLVSENDSSLFFENMTHEYSTTATAAQVPPNVSSMCHQYASLLQHKNDIELLHRYLDSHKNTIHYRSHHYMYVFDDDWDPQTLQNNSQNLTEDESGQSLGRFYETYENMTKLLKVRNKTVDQVFANYSSSVTLSEQQELFMEQFLEYLFKNDLMRFVTQPTLIEFQKELVESDDNFNVTHWLQWLQEEDSSVARGKRHVLYDPMQHSFHYKLHKKLAADVMVDPDSYEHTARLRRDTRSNERYTAAASYRMFLEHLGIRDTGYLYHDYPQEDENSDSDEHDESAEHIRDEEDPHYFVHHRNLTWDELSLTQQHFLDSGEHSRLETLINGMSYKQKRLLSWMIFCALHGRYCQDYLHPFQIQVQNSKFHDDEGARVRHSTAMHDLLEQIHGHHTHSRYLAGHRLGEIDWRMINVLPAIYTSEYHGDSLQIGFARHMDDSQWLPYEQEVDLKHHPSKEEASESIQKLIDLIAYNSKFDERFDLVAAGVEVSFAHVPKSLREWLECTFVSKLHTAMLESKNTFIRYETFIVPEYHPVAIVEHPACTNHLWFALNGLQEEEDYNTFGSFDFASHTDDTKEFMTSIRDEYF